MSGIPQYRNSEYVFTDNIQTEIVIYSNTNKLVNLAKITNYYKL